MAAMGDLSGFRTYEEWQAANRAAGGPGESADVKAAFSMPGTPGTGTDAAVNEANAAYNSGQRGSDPNVIFGPGGAAAYRAQYNSAQGGNRPEDLARFSDQTIAGWDQYMIKDGPNAGKYRSMRGAPGVFDKPTECPPGQGPQGGSETDPCGTAGYSTPGPGEGGGQGAGQGAGGAADGSAGYYGQDDPLQRMLANQMAAGAGSFAGTTSGGQFAGGGVFSEGAGQYGKPATTGTANPVASAALGALAPAAAPVAASFAAPAPEPMSYSDPYEAWKQGGRKGPAPGSSAIDMAAPTRAQYSAPTAPKPADVFGMAAPTSLPDLVNPGRPKRDARMGGSWF